jgi:hypothetical protein
VIIAPTMFLFVEDGERDRLKHDIFKCISWLNVLVFDSGGEQSFGITSSEPAEIK